MCWSIYRIYYRDSDTQGFFCVLRGPNSVPSPLEFRCIFSKFLKKITIFKKNIFFFLKIGIHSVTTSYRMTISLHFISPSMAIVYVCLFCCFMSHVNSYGHCGTVSSLNHTFSWAGLSKRLTSNLCTYFRL